MKYIFFCDIIFRFDEWIPKIFFVQEISQNSELNIQYLIQSLSKTYVRQARTRVF